MIAVVPLSGFVCALPTATNVHARTGTNAGYYAHKRAGEEPCDSCRTAYNVAQAGRRYRRAPGDGSACSVPTRQYPEGRTGTTSGYMAHYNANESPCRACVDGHAAAVKAKRVADPEEHLRVNLASKHKMTLAKYRELLAAQGGRCAICRTDAPTDVRTIRFHIDHDHSCCPGPRSCGRCVRGLLCHACNTALGNFKDDPEILEAALTYLLAVKRTRRDRDESSGQRPGPRAA